MGLLGWTLGILLYIFVGAIVARMTVRVLNQVGETQIGNEDAFLTLLAFSFWPLVVVVFVGVFATLCLHRLINYRNGQDDKR